MARHRVTHTFLLPTALKAMMKAVPAPRERSDLAFRAIMSAGEAVGDAVFAWSRDALGVVPNEMFGQTEINYIVGNCAVRWPARAGSLGRPYPGHHVIDDKGNECPRGTPGDAALHRRDVHGERDPIFVIGYWKGDDATRDKFTGDRLSHARRKKGALPRGAGVACDRLGAPWDSWCRSGHTAMMDEDGYLWYQGRRDGLFKARATASARARSRTAGSSTLPWPTRQWCRSPTPSAVRSSRLSSSSPQLRCLARARNRAQAHVRGKLAPYDYPKEIEFIDALPMTTTGKVQRRVLRLREEERARAKAKLASSWTE
jgi:acetyl-CoA synthetase